MKKLIFLFLFLFCFVFSAIAYAVSMQGPDKADPGHARAFQRMPKAKETPMEIFASGHGYVHSGGGTQADDTDTGDFIVGSQSLHVTTDGDGVELFSTSPTYSPTLDFTSSDFILKFKISGIDNVNAVRLGVSSDGFATTRYFWDLNNLGITSGHIHDNEWTTLTISIANKNSGFTDSNLAAINKMRLRVDDDATGPVEVWWNVIAKKSLPTAGMVTIGFDDSLSSQFSVAATKMAEYGFPGVAYVITDSVGTSGNLTLDELLTMQNLLGWEIGGHDSQPLEDISIEAAEDRIKNTKKWLVDNGFSHGVDHYAIPGGGTGITSAVTKLLEKYFVTVRSSTGIHETYPPANWTRLRKVTVTDTTTPATIATLIDNARVEKAWLHLLFHDIVASPSTTFEYSITNFNTIIDDIAADGIAVKTISQAIIDG